MLAYVVILTYYGPNYVGGTVEFQIGVQYRGHHLQIRNSCEVQLTHGTKQGRIPSALKRTYPCLYNQNTMEEQIYSGTECRYKGPEASSTSGEK